MQKRGDEIVIQPISEQHDDLSLNVVLASAQRGWHGGEEQFRQLALGLRKRGHNCVLFVRQGETCADVMAREGFEVVTFRGTGLSPLTLARLRSHLKQIKPDVLHSNGANALTSVGLASWGLDIPARIVSRRVDFPINSSWRYNLFANRVICISTAVAKVCRECGVNPASIRLVHSGVDPARMVAGNRARGRQALGCHETEKLLLCVATITDHKGHQFLLEAMSQVVVECPQAVLALVGDGDLTEEMKQHTAELGIEKHVRFLGYREDIPDLLAAADLFVLASHLEGLCTSVIDAMFAGRSIVVTQAGGLTDLMGETFSPEAPVGWTAPPSDAQALAATILEALLASDEEHSIRQNRARLRAERLFTADTMVEQMLQAYGEVLSTEVSQPFQTRKAA